MTPRRIWGSRQNGVISVLSRTQRVSDRSEDDASSFSSSQIRPLVREKKGRTHVKLMMKHQIAQVFRDKFRDGWSRKFG